MYLQLIHSAIIPTAPTRMLHTSKAMTAFRAVRSRQDFLNSNASLARPKHNFHETYRTLCRAVRYKKLRIS